MLLKVRGQNIDDAKKIAMPRKTPINLSDSLPQVKPQGGQPKLAKEMWRRGKRLSHEYVASEIAKEGHVLQSRYRNSRTKLDIKCDQGDQCRATWASFQQGRRCRSCDRNARSLPHEYVASEIAKEGHVLQSRYRNSYTKLDIKCDQGHRYQGSWSYFREGHRCQTCAKHGYNSNKPGRLYYIRFDFPEGLSLYKIGITNNTIKRRFFGEPTPYIVLRDLYFEDGAEALKEESRIKKLHAKYKYTGPNLLASGNTECFTRDILKLDRPACSAA
jgi:hypothetical protein